jgi:hypothetical protein
VEQSDTALDLRIVLTVEQTKLILGYVRELITPPAAQVPASPQGTPVPAQPTPATPGR